ncbi:Abi family protein [Arcanobacterium bovis]|nr:Abi family protein [Arcanobacterium bovis]
MPGEKPFLSLDDQLKLLQDRGLLVTTPESAKSFLKTNNYYRFSGYAREFQEDPRNGDNKFVDGVSFEKIQELMECDRQLRRLLLQALEYIEISVRSAFAYQAGKVYGNQAFYLNPSEYVSQTQDLEKFISKLEHQLSRKNQPTVERYAPNGDYSALPIWVAVETMSFGSLVRICQYIAKPQVVLDTADSLSITRQSFSDTLHAFLSLRNRCAHYGQLWNRSFDIAFKVQGKEKRCAPPFSHPGSYGGILVIRRWLKALNICESWFEEVENLLNSNVLYQQGILTPRMK